MALTMGLMPNLTTPKIAKAMPRPTRMAQNQP